MISGNGATDFGEQGSVSRLMERPLDAVKCERSLAHERGRQPTYAGRKP